MKTLRIRNRTFYWGTKTYIMGIVNVTPDSFSDGLDCYHLDQALERAQMMIQQGVDLIDVGGESTRPGANPVSVTEELDRVIGVINAIRQMDNEIIISIDTTKAMVAQEAIAAGADLINDISGATFDSNMLQVAANNLVPIILMHSRGTPQNMQQHTVYENLIPDIITFFKNRIAASIEAKISPDKIIIDPGIGFAKNYSQNLQIIRDINQFKILNQPILLGVSRKSFIGTILHQPDPKERLSGTIAACCAAIPHVDLVRIHDVLPVKEAIQVADAILRDGS